jgi:hypothetical protein
MTPQPCSNLPQNQLLLAMLGGATLGVLLVAIASPATRRETRAAMLALGDRILGRTGKAAPHAGEEVVAVFI